MRAQARRAEVELLRAMRSDWQALKPQWYRALLPVLGPDDYYQPASVELREEFRKLREDMKLADPAVSGDEWLEWHHLTRARSHEYEQAARDVLYFLGALASVVFSGRLSPELAYTVVGPDIPRRSRQVRALLGLEAPKRGIDLEEEVDEEVIRNRRRGWQYWVDNLPGLTERVLGLLDVLWAEAARQYDIEPLYLGMAAVHKHNTGSGLQNRLRVRRLAKEHRSRLTGWRLERRLIAAEYPPFGPARPKTDLPLLFEVIPDPIRGWGFEGWLQRNRAFLTGRLQRPQVESPNRGPLH